MRMISHTRVSMYEQCPQSVKFRYELKLKGPKSTAASRGSDIHNSIEKYILKGKGKYLHKDVKKWKHLFKFIRSKAPFVEEKLGVNKKWKNETWDDGKAYIIGVVDAAYLEGNMIEGQEWKSGKMYDNHADQRDLYSALLMARWPASQKVRMTSYYLDLGKQKSITYTHEQIEPIRREFQQRIDFMENDKILAPRPGWYCKWCPYSRFVNGPCRKG